MTALGFPVSTEQDFRHYTYQASEFGQTIDAFSGAYTLWAPGRGIELWVQTNLHRRIIGMNPHFTGRGRMRVLLTKRIVRRDHSILDGTFSSLVKPTRDDPAMSAYSFVFDAPDYDLYNELELPYIACLQLAAFAHTLQGYESEEAFNRAQPEGSVVAPMSFLAAGHCSSEGQNNPKEAQQARAILSGRVLATEKIINPVTNQQFYWALVHTPAGKLDVIADPQVVQGKITVNGIVRGVFWLSGRIHLDEQ